MSRTKLQSKRRNRAKAQRKTQKRVFLGFYENRSGALFVPNELMLCLHDAARPTAILKRCGLSATQWDRWRAKCSWLPKWLYHEPLPLSVLDFQPTQDMLAFRRESTVEAIARAAMPNRKSRARTYSTPGWYLRRFANLSWFRSWLTRGEQPPQNVRVATLDEIRAMRAWCDYVGHCVAAKITWIAFDGWWHKEKFPPGNQVDWLKWLFAFRAPPGWFVIDDKAVAIRSHRTLTGTLSAAGVPDVTYRSWKKDPDKCKALDAAVAAAAANGKRSTALRNDEFVGLQPRTQDAMWSFARAKLLKTACARAKSQPSDYYCMLKDAEKVGGAALRLEVQRYLDGEEQTSNGAFFTSTRPAKQLFVPSRGMRAFRSVAADVHRKQRIWKLAQTIPCFDEWFADWASPYVRFGQRSVRASAAQLTKPNGETVVKAHLGDFDRVKVAGHEIVLDVDSERAPSQQPTDAPPAKARRGKRGPDRAEEIVQRDADIYDEHLAGTAQKVIARQRGLSLAAVQKICQRERKRRRRPRKPVR